MNRRSIQFIDKVKLVWKVKRLDKKSFSVSTITSSTSDHHHHCGVTVFRDVRYSDSHERNLMDIYKPSSVTADDNSSSIIYIHGGMWLRGSKDQQMLSYTDISYELANKVYKSVMTTTGIQSSDDDQVTQSTKKNSFSNNVGMTMAYGKSNVYIPNYRLVGRTCHETVYPQQIYDIARAIKYALLQELKKTTDPKLWISGHSAGAHLAALVLSDDKFMNHVQTEKYTQEDEDNESYLSLDWRDMISGFIGISGPYNLQRLAMSPMADITIGPAFLGKVHTPSNSTTDGRSTNTAVSDNFDNRQIIKEASPIHVLLKHKTTKEEEQSNHSQEKKDNLITTNQMPLLVQIPVLLLNAESDFHLHKDSTELVVALKQLCKDCQNLSRSKSSMDESKKTGKSQHPVEHEIIKGTNHLTIMKNFGSGLIPNVSQNEVDDSRGDEEKEPKGEGMESTSMFSQASNLITYVGDAVYKNIMPEMFTSRNNKDEVASTIFKFMKSNHPIQIK